MICWHCRGQVKLSASTVSGSLTINCLGSMNMQKGTRKLNEIIIGPQLGQPEFRWCSLPDQVCIHWWPRIWGSKEASSQGVALWIYAGDDCSRSCTTRPLSTGQWAEKVTGLSRNLEQDGGRWVLKVLWKEVLCLRRKLCRKSIKSRSSGCSAPGHCVQFWICHGCKSSCWREGSRATVNWCLAVKKSVCWIW